jgi:hypothetical protein
MTKRERLLAALVGLLVLVAVLFYSVQKIRGVFRSQTDQVQQLEKEIRDKTRMVRLSQEQRDRLETYKRRSLPSEVEKARALYQNWLFGLVKEVGFEDAQVDVLPARGEKGVYQMLSFKVTGRGDLRRVVDFLYRFYSADLLHRIRHLYAKRTPGTRHLTLSFSIDAISLPEAASKDKLNDQPSKRLRRGDQADYLAAILGRNLSGPANKEPALEPIGSKTAYLNSPFSFVVAARDPDKLDRVTYRLEANGLNGARLDPQSGRFEWSPDKKGEYEVSIAATDDGFPPKTSRQTGKITVTDPPPDATVDAGPPKPNFDKAQFAYVTAITEDAAGRWQAWITLRTDGKSLKLFEGDQFDVGEVKVTVTRIEERSVELHAAVLEKRLVVSLGQNLAEGRELSPEGT